MHETVIITDTSCLIALTKLNCLVILQKLYRNVVVSEEIAAEFGEPLPNWITIKSVANKNYQQILEGILDRGEASAIALALENENPLLIVDDLKGRKEAQRLKIKITGTLGVLFAAKQKGHLAELKSYLTQLQSFDFRIAPSIVNELLKQTNEL